MLQTVIRRPIFSLHACVLSCFSSVRLFATPWTVTIAGIKIVGRSINKLRYADDTTLMAESEEELISL